MSTEQVSETAKKTLKTVRELLEKAEASTHKALEKAAPAVSKSIDSSIEAASKGFNSTMKTIDGATVGDQVKLLKAYRKFIGGQADYVDNRIRTLEDKIQSRKSPPT